jgi:hypothetical protein
VAVTLSQQLMSCCFCGGETDLDDYVEIEARIDESEASQLFGAHASHFAERLHVGYQFGLESSNRSVMPEP